MAYTELADRQALQEKLEALDLEKGVLKRKLQALQYTGSDPVTDRPSTANENLRKDGDVASGLYLGDRPYTAEGRLEVYRRLVAARTANLQLRLIGSVGASSASSAGFYIDPETDLNAPESIVAAALKAARRGERKPFPPPHDGSREMEPDAGNPRPIRALEAAILRRSQVLLGAPGSGKTSILSFIANALATGNIQGLGGWPAAERNYLPIFVFLGDYAAWISTHRGAQQAGASLLWDFILHDLRERNIGFAAEALNDTLKRDALVLLLDALDEVPSQLLPPVRGSIEDWGRQHVGCRILVTCRALAYQQPRWRLSSRYFPKTTLLPLDSQRIDQFIDSWYRQDAGSSQASPGPTKKKAKSLRRLVHKSGLRQLASNPMLLAHMALVHGCRKELPDARAPLYEETVAILLWRRERDNHGNVPELTDLLWEAGRKRSDLIGLLEQISFDICTGAEAAWDTGCKEQSQSTGVSEQDLIDALRQLHPQKHLEWAQEVMDALKLHSGLLIESQPGTFSFLHRSFQEYLAGARLAHFLDFPERAAALLTQWSIWGDTVLQAIGFLVHNQREVERPLLLAERLCPPQAPSDELGWRKVWLAGEVLLEIGLSRARDTEQGVRLLERISNRLAALVERGVLQPRERARAGDVLGVIRDGRFDHTRFHLPALFRGTREKAIGLVAVPPGPFVMGSREDDQDPEHDEVGNPEKQSIDYLYWIARYPVTVAEITAFIIAGGYDSAEWWTESGLVWHGEQDRQHPDEWSHQATFGNRPAVGVSWFEAMAYARWLDAQLRQRTGHIPADYLVRLPTEAEWEKAARGPDGRRYPWGGEWEDGRANVAESIGRPATVGGFPTGETPSGIQDMSGNVWEWCLTEYRHYPYRPDDGRNKLEAGGRRALRGGSWLQDPHAARCASRLGLSPDRSRRDVGFRLVLSVVKSIV